MYVCVYMLVCVCVYLYILAYETSVKQSYLRTGKKIMEMTMILASSHSLVSNTL